MTNETDPWEIGTLDHYALWEFYSGINYVATAVCLYFARGVWRLGRRQRPTDVLLSGLCSACALMSVTCATQCALCLAHGNRFYGGRVACQIEAYFHVCSILVQFLCIAMTAVCCYDIVVARDVTWNTRRAQAYVGVAWVVGPVGTLVLSLRSPIYLMPAGAYCFFSFSSAVMIAWFVPVMLVALITTAYSYLRIYQVSSRGDLATRAYVVMPKGAPAFATAAPSARPGSASPRAPDVQPPARSRADTPDAPTAAPITTRARPISAKVAKKSILFPLLFLAGWFPAVVTCAYELSGRGRISQGFDTAVGVCGSLHSLMVPVLYGYYNRHLRDLLTDDWPCLRRVWHATRVGDTGSSPNASDPAAITSQSPPASVPKLQISVAVPGGAPSMLPPITSSRANAAESRAQVVSRHSIVVSPADSSGESTARTSVSRDPAAPAPAPDDNVLGVAASASPKSGRGNDRGRDRDHFLRPNVSPRSSRSAAVSPQN